MPQKSDPCAAIFLGTAQVDRDIRCTFISGAVECSSAVFQWDSIKLDDSFWDYIYKAKKQYFPDLEIVGWFLGRAGQPMELPAAVESAHRKYFAGRDKLLMLMDPLEEEEIFFVHEQGCLQKREGYYIYYEKNIKQETPALIMLHDAGSVHVISDNRLRRHFKTGTRFHTCF